MDPILEQGDSSDGAFAEQSAVTDNYVAGCEDKMADSSATPTSFSPAPDTGQGQAANANPIPIGDH